MSTPTRWIKRRVLAAAVAAVGVVAIAGTALAGHQTSGVKSYTGCLVSGDGVMIKIKEGNAPKSACSGGQVEAHFSGGDITKISVGSGLSLPNGGDNGEVRIVLDASHSLPQGCDDGEVAKWETSTDPDKWVCRADNDTTYSPGTGLDLSAGNAFSIEPDYRVKNTPDCPSGEFAKGFSDAGVIDCVAPASPSGIEVWQKTASGPIDLPDGEGVDLVAVPLPAGTFLITAVATVRDESGVGDDQFSVRCLLRNGAFAALPVNGSFVDIGEGQVLPGAMTVVHGLLSLASSDTVRFTCFGAGDNNKADAVTLTAVNVGTVHTP
jgi:hypothetical protein